jgi:hypothetical protein
MFDLPEPPPVEPDGETMLTDKPIFVAACEAAVADDVQQFQWHLGNSLLTQTEKWELVWRIDFTVPGNPTTLNRINRAVFWGEADGTINGMAVAFDQQVVPLG